MEMSGKLYALTALSSGKSPAPPQGRCERYEEKRDHPRARDWKLNVHPVESGHTHWAISNPRS
jgi:hypothetical protein